MFERSVVMAAAFLEIVAGAALVMGPGVVFRTVRGGMLENRRRHARVPLQADVTCTAVRGVSNFGSKAAATRACTTTAGHSITPWSAATTPTEVKRMTTPKLKKRRPNNALRRDPETVRWQTGNAQREEANPCKASKCYPYAFRVGREQ